MLSDVLQARIQEYTPANAIEQENVLQELMQQYILASLSRSGLFSEAMFHGGFERYFAKKIRVKLEIDTNPPAGSAFETSYLSFPATAPITTQSLCSGLGTKAHALLCRKYVKGRDWYCYVARPLTRFVARSLT